MHAKGPLPLYSNAETGQVVSHLVAWALGNRLAETSASYSPAGWESPGQLTRRSAVGTQGPGLWEHL